VLRYEIKFSIDETQAQQVLDWAGAHLTLDSHATNAEAGSYRTKTLYLDNETKDVYRRCGSYKHHKFRLRRYGDEPFVFLERKSSWSHQVKKYRTVIPESDLPLLGSCQFSSSWEGSWFHRRISSKGLKPSYQVGYERTAYVGTPGESPMRLTMDRQIGSRLAPGWSFADFGGLPLFGERVILELKYCDLLPLPFHNLIQSLGLTLSRISKYRLAVQASEQISRQEQVWLRLMVDRSIFTELRDEVPSS
jgi:hypothetical protein